MSNIIVSEEASTKFLNWLGHVRINRLTPKVGDQRGKMIWCGSRAPSKEDLQLWAETGCQVYYELHPSEVNKKSEEAEVQEVRFLAVDLDPPDGFPAQEAMEQLQDSIFEMVGNSSSKPWSGPTPPPSAIVKTGRGFQLLWRLVEPMQLTTPELRQQVKAVTKALHLQFEGIAKVDAGNTSLLCQLLRLPGSWNPSSADKISKGFQPGKVMLLRSNDLSHPFSSFLPFKEAAADRIKLPSGPSKSASDWARHHRVQELVEKWSSIPVFNGAQIQECFKKYGVESQAWDRLKDGGPDPEVDAALAAAGFPIQRSADDSGSAKVEWRVICAMARARVPLEDQLSVLKSNAPGLKASKSHMAMKNNPFHMAKQVVKAAELPENQPKSQERKPAPEGPKTLVNSKEETQLVTFSIKGLRVDSLSFMAGQIIQWLQMNEDLYRFNGVLARWSSSDRTMRILDAASLNLLISRKFQFGEEKMNKEGDTYWKLQSSIPAGLATSILSANHFPNIRNCSAVFNHPTVDKNGNLFGLQCGYDPHVKAYYDHDFKFEMMEEEEAAATLFEPLREFTPKALRGALSAIFSQLTRPHVGNTPMHMFEACNPGSGKTLLAEVCSTIVTGRYRITTASEDSTEFEKAINGLVLGGKELIFLDNITGHLKSSILDAALTCGDEYEARQLGRSDSVAVQFKACVFATANNVSLSPDLHRRTIRVDVDPGVENPEMRKTDRGEDELKSFVSENRAKLLNAAISWLQHSSAMQFPYLKRFGSFEAWNRVVPKAVHSLMLQWQRMNLVDITTPTEVVTVDRQRDEVSNLGPFLYEASKLGENGFTLARVLDKSDGSLKDLREALEGLIGSVNDTRSASNRLQKHVGRRINGMRLVTTGPSNLTKRWRVEGEPIEKAEPAPIIDGEMPF